MKIWLLRPIETNRSAWEPWYDKAFGFVIQASDEREARELANDNGGDEVGLRIRSTRVYRTGGDPWLDPKQSTCEELGAEGTEAEVIIRDFASA